MLECLIATEEGALPLQAVTPDALDLWLAGLPTATAAFLRASGFAAKAQELRLLPGPEGLAGAVLGLGADPILAASPWAYGALPFSLPEGTAWRLQGAPDAVAATLGWCLGAYRFAGLKSRQGRQPARLAAPPGSDAAQQQAAAIQAGRDLINTPANLLGPAELAAAVQRLAAAQGAAFELIAGAALEQGFPAIHAVGQGSPRAPQVAVLRWEGAADGPLVALCGKGVCFDTGGLDLKPAGAMLRMKKDMGGAAAMIAAAEMLMRAQAPIRLLLLVGAVENSVSGAAFRPMDVIRTRKGLTVEIGNTDAEGRLVLADLLAFAGEHAPDLILDAATLTGAARVALGPDLPALFSNDSELAQSIHCAGQVVHDAVWQLPLVKNYVSWLDSPVADLNNVSTKPMAGAVIAALFLQHFVPNDVRWAHFDLYAWNDQTRPGRPEGGEIHAARAIAHAVAKLATGQANPGR
ncbi:leucyl aminopeptidase family protein [Falsiroseomonas selenitidurans]|uniref:Leucyl aminopeptidase family protein n=1 Tax=Falsiroseomonas selenitidurans TaxID=2716335 RepID=A0ABX1E7I2_9PROT|nr:leucyl aminopeptidase family protein [Falsiroseomonas selenitidurans]NKC32685.1 leucyl aminopeptidase family protein [Falsiroseomonas selenitidurans]